MPVKLHTLFALVLAGTALSACAHHAEAAAAPPSAQVLTESNKAKALAVGQALVAQDRAAEAEHRAEMDRLIDVSVKSMRDEDRQTTLLVTIVNKNKKAISSLEAGLEVHSAATGRRIGLAEIHIGRKIAANSSATFPVALRYVRFGEDAGTMRPMEGRPKRASLEATEVKYADGSDAGYDD